jgi:hypothetical protein
MESIAVSPLVAAVVGVVATTGVLLLGRLCGGKLSPAVSAALGLCCRKAAAATSDGKVTSDEVLEVASAAVDLVKTVVSDSAPASRAASVVPEGSEPDEGAAAAPSS